MSWARHVGSAFTRSIFADPENLRSHQTRPMNLHLRRPGRPDRSGIASTHARHHTVARRDAMITHSGVKPGRFEGGHSRQAV
jgi:hypothetical protein